MKKLVYLNNAATSFPKPKSVLFAVNSCLRKIPTDQSRSNLELIDEGIVSRCREKLAVFFNAKDANSIIFTSGGTESLNMAIKGLCLQGDHVITTALEHNSVLRPLKHLEREGTIQLSIVDCDNNGIVDPQSVTRAINKNTKILIINHGSNVNGRLVDMDALAQIAHENGLLLVVDASQSAGSIGIDVEGSLIDVFAFTGHKSLLGIQGSGGLYLREGIELKPLKVGGTGVKSELLFQPKERPWSYEAGTHNLPGIAALEAGIDFITKTGIKNINKVKKSHIKRITDKLKRMPYLTIHGGADTENRLTILSFTIKGFSPLETGYILEESFGIITRAGLHCAPLIHRAIGSYPNGTVRVSPSFFTTPDEIDYFIDSVGRICSGKVTV